MKDFLKDKKTVLNYIYIAVIFVSVLVMVILGLNFKSTRKEQTVPETATEKVELEKKENVKITVNVETIKDGLNNMGTLITQEYYFSQIATYTKDKKILNFINSTAGFTYSYDGSVTAGIDFEKVEIKKDEDAKMIIVELPHSSIQTVNIDTSTFKVYSEKESLWNKIKLEDYNLSLGEFEEAAKKKALDNGILDKSDEQAKTLIVNFIQNFPNVSDYGIEVKFIKINQ